MLRVSAAGFRLPQLEVRTLVLAAAIRHRWRVFAATAVLLGWLGDNVSFAVGFLVYGLILIGGSALPFLLKLKGEGG